MLEVSVPCAGCGGPVGFGQSKCRACGVALSRDARLALHERLTASSSDYRELQDNISSARTVLLVIAVIYIAIGIIGYVVHGRSLVNSPEEDAVARGVLIESVLTSVVFLACWYGARTMPLPAILGGTALWLGLQAVGAAVLSVSLLSGLWGKAVALILLGRGILASVRANAFRRRLQKAGEAPS